MNANNKHVVFFNIPLQQFNLIYLTDYECEYFQRVLDYGYFFKQHHHSPSNLLYNHIMFYL